MTERRSIALIELTRARLLEIAREPGVVFWVFGFPVLMAFALGLAFRTRPPAPVLVAVTSAQTAAPAEAPTADTSVLLDVLAANDELEPRSMTPDAALEALRKGEVELVVESLVAPPSVEPVVRYRFDPSRPQGRHARLLADATLQRAAGRTDTVETHDVETTARGSRYIDFLLPGLIGLNLMSSSMWGVGFAIVLLRTRKLLKRYAATPMRRLDFLLATMLSRLVLLVVELAFLVAIGWFVFGVEVRGSLVALLLVSVVGSTSFVGIALMIAARTKTVEVASGLMNAVMLPMWLCGGAFFAYTRFPDVLHPVLRALPLTALNDALRAITNDGASLLAVGPQLLVLIAWTVVSFAVALRIFRWQ